MFVNAVDERTGQEKWRTKTPARVFTSGAIAAGNVYFGTWGGDVNWYDAATGKQVGGAMAEAAVNSSPVIAEGVLYFGSGLFLFPLREVIVPSATSAARAPLSPIRPIRR
jgi:outer membrane protein assembly factor BamB